MRWSNENFLKPSHYKQKLIVSFVLYQVWKEYFGVFIVFCRAVQTKHPQLWLCHCWRLFSFKSIIFFCKACSDRWQMQVSCYYKGWVHKNKRQAELECHKFSSVSSVETSCMTPFLQKRAALYTLPQKLISHKKTSGLYQILWININFLKATTELWKRNMNWKTLSHHKSNMEVTVSWSGAVEFVYSNSMLNWLRPAFMTINNSCRYFPCSVME